MPSAEAFEFCNKIPTKNHFSMKIFFLFVPLFLISCATNGVADFRSSGINENVVLEPTIGNGYKGVLVEMPPSLDGALLTRANEICSTRGGLLKEPLYTHSAPIGWKFYSYSCVGFQKPKTKIEQPVIQPIPTITKSTGIDEAKSKCEGLGFQVGSESFGNCVLKLSK